MTRCVPFADVPGFEVIDIVHSPATIAQRRQWLAQLSEVHAEFFPDHAHVMGEIADVMAHPVPGVVVHPWLFLYEGRPVGQYIFHTCLRRGIVLMHFLSLDPSLRHVLPVGWLEPVTDALQATAQADADRAGVRLLGMTAEVYRTDHDYRRWYRQGFHLLGIDYQEPDHGMHWADFGEPEFFPMTMILKPIDAGVDLPLSQVIDAALVTFHLDHYRLPPDHPVVVGLRHASQDPPPDLVPARS